MKKLILIIALSVLMVACGNQEESDQSSEPQASEQQSESERETRREVRNSGSDQTSGDNKILRPQGDDPSKKVPRLEGSSEVDGHGLTMIVDGSSPEAFQESLELIANDTSKSQYERLHSALLYLRVYAPEGWSGLPDLYRSLDGMTGEEIIELASERRANRKGNRN